jgi:hypothetical protein
MQNMKPILFSTPMVRALLDGRKTQTRRIVKPQPINRQRVIEGLAHVTHGMDPKDDGAVWYVADGINPGTEIRCPYGSPGDLFWVRESVYIWGRWVANGKTKTGKPERRFEALGRHVKYEGDDPPLATVATHDARGSWNKRPSIHMPRSACRLVLRVTEVRVQRLQEISEADAIAEGADDIDGERIDSERYIKASFLEMTAGKNHGCAFAQRRRAAFWHLWDQINGKGSWASNPWVWTVTFEVVVKTNAEAQALLREVSK